MIAPRRLTVVTIALVAMGRALPAQSADSIIAKYVAARGGLDRLHAIQTERLTGRFSSPGGEGADTVELARPGRVRTQITFNGQSFIQAYDGSTAWTVNPFGGSGAPEALPPAAAANVIAGGDFEGALVDYARKGNRVVLAGTDTADGKPAWKLVVTLPSGLVDNYYIDAASFLETKWEGGRTVNDQPVTFETFFRDYRQVSGVMFPFRIDSDAKGRAGGQHIILDTITLDVPIPDARFAMPGH